MDAWIANVLLVAPAAHRALAAHLFGQATGRLEDAAPEAFGVRLCALGGGEVTHWACHTRIRRSTLAALPQLAALVPGALWCVTAHDDDTELERAARASVVDFLAAHGLAVEREAEEG